MKLEHNTTTKDFLNQLYTAYSKFIYKEAWKYCNDSEAGVQALFSLPTIPNGSEVVDVQLSLYKTAYTQRNGGQMPIDVYKVTTDLPSSYFSYYDWFSKMTWRRIDYAFCKAGKEYVTCRLTALVKKWYVEGTDNTTVALAMTNEEY